jgi:uncharacterized membrane protein (UPF0127 family)
MSTASFSLMNARTLCAVADAVEVALSRKARRKGLLGRVGLAPFSALVLAPCGAVHTMFMRFAIDVIFVDSDGRVVHIVPHLAPWRTAMTFSARAVVELPAGTLASREVAIGDTLYLTPVSGGRLPLSAADLREQLC